jgi:hypothetical protein
MTFDNDMRYGQTSDRTQLVHEITSPGNSKFQVDKDMVRDWDLYLLHQSSLLFVCV